MAKRKAWLTPDTPPPEMERGRCFSVPDDNALVGAVTGALLPLTQEENWEQDGSMSPAEAASIMSAAFELFVNGECGSAGCDFGTDYPPIRREADGTTKVWSGEEWVTPTGDLAIPAPAERTEETEAERKCNAAGNVASVLHTLFDDLLYILENVVDPAVQKAEMAASIAVAIGALFGPMSETFLVLNEYFWGALNAAITVLTEADWSAVWHSELVCILQGNITETDNIPSVDFVGFQADLVGFILPVVDDYVLQRWVVYYLCLIIGQEGLSVAAGLDAAEEDCAECGEWCYQFEATAGALDAWTMAKGVRLANGRIRVQVDPAPMVRDIDISLVVDTSDCVIRGITARCEHPSGCGTLTYVTYYATPGFNGQTTFIYANAGSWHGSQGLETDLTTSNETTLRLHIENNCTGQTCELTGIRVWGTGRNPFSTGSNC